jgi:hypothetical protein
MNRLYRNSISVLSFGQFESLAVTFYPYLTGNYCRMTLRKRLLLALLIPSVLYGQDAELEWVNTMGGWVNDYGSSVVADDAGDLYCVGYFHETFDFDPGAGFTILSSNGMFDVFIQKLNEDGNLIWARSFGSTNDDYATSVDTDREGNVYVTGFISWDDSVDFDPGPGTYNLHNEIGMDIFIVKLDSAGNFIWAKTLQGDVAFAVGNDLHVDKDQNVCVTGYFASASIVYPLDFDPGPGSYPLAGPGSNDAVFVLKLDQHGNFLWAHVYGNPADENEGTSITSDSLGNVNICGYFGGTIDFDNGPGINNAVSNGLHDIFVLQLDPEGGFNWVKSIGGASNDRAQSVFYAQGYLHFTGRFATTVDFLPGPGFMNLTSAGSWDTFVAKMDLGGTTVWAKNFGGASDEWPWGIAVDYEGNIYNTGGFQLTSDFDPGVGSFNVTSNGGLDVYILKLDSFGNLVWAQTFGSVLEDLGTGIALSASSEVYTTGKFRDTVDFDPGSDTLEAASAGYYDIFVHKLGSCVRTGVDIQTWCNSFTWIDGLSYTENNNSAFYVLENAASTGCDSIVFLDLTMVGAFINSTTTYLEALPPLAVYQWLDCNDNYAPISFETWQNFYPSVIGEYAVAVDISGCIDTSDCAHLEVADLLEPASNQLIIFPNPTRGPIHITGEDLGGLTFSLHDARGRLIDVKVPGHVLSFDFYLPETPGIYYVSVQDGTEIKNYRVVRE